MCFLNNVHKVGSAGVGGGWVAVSCSSSNSIVCNHVLIIYGVLFSNLHEDMVTLWLFSSIVIG